MHIEYQFVNLIKNLWSVDEGGGGGRPIFMNY